MFTPRSSLSLVRQRGFLISCLDFGLILFVNSPRTLKCMGNTEKAKKKVQKRKNPPTPKTTPESQVPAKRGRGRPRKNPVDEHPVTSPSPLQNITDSLAKDSSSFEDCSDSEMEGQQAASILAKLEKMDKDSKKAFQKASDETKLRFDDVSSKLQQIESNISGIRKDVDSLASRVLDIEQSTSRGSMDVLNEVAERQHRERNLLIFNLQESQSADFTERKTMDIDSASKFLIAHGIGAKPVATVRLGKQVVTGRPRPLRIIFNDPQLARDALFKFIKSKVSGISTDYRDVRMDNDLTTLQQVQKKEAMTQLTLIRRTDSGAKLRFVNGSFRIWRSRNVMEQSA